MLKTETDISQWSHDWEHIFVSDWIKTEPEHKPWSANTVPLVWFAASLAAENLLIENDGTKCRDENIHLDTLCK